MQTITAHINERGRIILDKDILKKIIGKDVKIILEDTSNAKKISVNISSDSIEKNSFWDLLIDGPKMRGPKGIITREWIHNRGKDDIRYR